VLLLLLLLSLR